MRTVFLNNKCPFLKQLLSESGVQIPGIRILVLEGKDKIISFKDHILLRLISVVPEEKKLFFISVYESIKKKEKTEILEDHFEEMSAAFE